MTAAKNAAALRELERFNDLRRRAEAETFIVVEIVPGGMLVNNMVSVPGVSSSLQRVGGGGGAGSVGSVRGSKILFLEGFPNKGLADEERVTGMFAEDGIHIYFEANTRRSLRKFVYVGPIPPPLPEKPADKFPKAKL